MQFEHHTSASDAQKMKEQQQRNSCIRANWKKPHTSLVTELSIFFYFSAHFWWKDSSVIGPKHVCLQTAFLDGLNLNKPTISRYLLWWKKSTNFEENTFWIFFKVYLIIIFGILDTLQMSQRDQPKANQLCKFQRLCDAYCGE